MLRKLTISKKLQFSCNKADNSAMLSIHEGVNLAKFHKNRTLIADFSLKVNS